MQTLYPNVPQYGQVPRGISDSQMLASLEGRLPQQPAMPMIGKVGGTIATDPQPVPQQGQTQQGVVAQAQPTYQSPSAEETARNVATNTATNFAAQQAGSALTGGGAPATPVIVNGAPVSGASGAGTAGSGFLGTNGATLGSAGVGAAGAATLAYGLAGGMDAYGKIQQGGEKGKEGWAQAAITSNPMTMWAWPLVSPAFDLFDTGKPEAQQRRDTVRTGLQRTGILNDKYEFELPNGQFYYTGNDGNTPEYQIQNPDRPLTGRVIGAAQAMAAIMLGGPGVDAEQLTGQLTNMALSNAATYEQAMENLMFQFRKFVQQSGLTPQGARDEIQSWVKEGLMDEQTAQAYLAAHESFVEGNPWQFTNEAAEAPMEGAGDAAMPTYTFDPAGNLRSGTPTTAAPSLAEPSMPGPAHGPRMLPPQQAPKIAPARGAGPLPTQGPIRNLTPNQAPPKPSAFGLSRANMPPHIQEILIRGR